MCNWCRQHCAAAADLCGSRSCMLARCTACVFLALGLGLEHFRVAVTPPTWKVTHCTHRALDQSVLPPSTHAPSRCTSRVQSSAPPVNS